jgi:hypothetical protein
MEKHNWIVKGSVRGIVYDGKSELSARRALLRDKHQCRDLGGGAFSDCELFCDGKVVED